MEYRGKKHYSHEAVTRQVPPHSDILNRIAEPIPVADISGSETQDLINTLFRVAHGRQGDADFPTLVGLAAPQIGVSKRAVVIGVDAAGNGEPPTLKEFINPFLISRSQETVEDREGCFSTGRVCGIVSRAESVTLRAYDRNGVEFAQDLKGLPARIAQHEIDHLDGIRFPDRITDDNNLHWVEEAEYGRYRKEWRTWAVHCLRERWKEIKAERIVEVE